MLYQNQIIWFIRKTSFVEFLGKYPLLLSDYVKGWRKRSWNSEES